MWYKKRGDLKQSEQENTYFSRYSQKAYFFFKIEKTAWKKIVRFFLQYLNFLKFLSFSQNMSSKVFEGDQKQSENRIEYFLSYCWKTWFFPDHSSIHPWIKKNSGQKYFVQKTFCEGSWNKWQWITA